MTIYHFVFLPIFLINILAEINQDAKLPDIGICNGLELADGYKDVGVAFLEEGVGTVLKPKEADMVFQETLDNIEKSPLPIRSALYFLPGDLKSVGPDQDIEKIKNYAEVIFKRSKQAGIDYVVFGSGGSRRIPEGFAYEEARIQFVELNKQLAPIAESYGITLVLEPLNKKECNFILSLAEAGAIVEEVDHPNFGLLADIYHMMMENEGPESIDRYGHLLKHVHVAELEGRSVPGRHQEDLSRYYKALQNASYKGGISIETNETITVEEAKKAVQIIHKQWVNK